MGLRRVVAPRLAFVGLGILLFCCLTGCQTTSSVSTGRLIAHQAMIDFSGLCAPDPFHPERCLSSIPNHWESRCQHKQTALHSSAMAISRIAQHRRWRRAHSPAAPHVREIDHLVCQDAICPANQQRR